MISIPFLLILTEPDPWSAPIREPVGSRKRHYSGHYPRYCHTTSSVRSEWNETAICPQMSTVGIRSVAMRLSMLETLCDLGTSQQTRTKSKPILWLIIHQRTGTIGPCWERVSSPPLPSPFPSLRSALCRPPDHLSAYCWRANRRDFGRHPRSRVLKIPTQYPVQFHWI